MSVTMKYKVSFGENTEAGKPTVTRLARRLALAHAIERLVETGVLGTYAEAASAMGITRASMAAIIDLRFQPVPVQEGILSGRERRSERALRKGLCIHSCK